MSKQASPTLIGAFVVGAVALLVIATVLFGGSALFTEKSRFVTYFEGSVKGLRVGSNVTFRGVRIGYVTDVQIQAQIDSLKTLIPVTIEIVPSAFQILDGDRPFQTEELADRLPLQKLIDAGLRAQLDVESFVTGQLLVELDFLPEHAAVMRGVKPPHPEIPTIPNDIEQAIGSIERLIAGLKEKVDIDEVINNVQGILHGLNELTNSPDLRNGLAGLNTLVHSQDLHGGIAGLNTLINSPDTQRLSASVTAAAEELDVALQETRKFVGSASHELVQVTDQLSDVLRQLETSLLTAERSLQVVEMKLRDESELSYQVNETLGELEGAARSLRVFLDYLEQHPDALIRGRQGRQK